MKFHKQVFRHRPEEGIFGDCVRTAIACVLDLDPEEIPHEHREMTNTEHNALLDAFLHERGIRRINLALTTDDVDAALRTAAEFSDGLPHLFSGTSGNGVNHVVVAQDGKIIHDPAIDSSGIIGPTSAGSFWIEWLVRPVETIDQTGRP